MVILSIGVVSPFLQQIFSSADRRPMRSPGPILSNRLLAEKLSASTFQNILRRDVAGAEPVCEGYQNDLYGKGSVVAVKGDNDEISYRSSREAQTIM